MLLSEKNTLAVLRRFSINVPSYTSFTKKSDIRSSIADFDPNCSYMVSSREEKILVGFSDLEAAIVRALGASDEVLVSGQYDAVFAGAMELHISRDCKVFLEISSPKGQVSEEIVNKRLWDFQIERAMRAVGVLQDCSESFISMVQHVVEAFYSCDAVRLVVDPLVVTRSKMPMVGRAFMEIDDFSAHKHKEFFKNMPVAAYPVEISTLFGNLVCIANGRSLALACVEYFVSSGLQPSLVLDVGSEVNEAAIVDALKVALAKRPTDKIFIYLFSGLTNAIVVAKAIYQSIPESGSIGLLLEGTNIAGAKYVLRDVQNQCRMLTSLLSAVEWARGG